MVYEIFINGNYTCEQYSIIDMINYIHDMNLTILNEHEFTDYNLVKIYCVEVKYARN